MSINYPVAEKFFSIQGEGSYTGTPMAFIRLVGCSVGKLVCANCDTDFERMNTDKGGGLFTPEELKEWVFSGGIEHVCITGGEPLDRDIRPLLFTLTDDGPVMCHIETSGTVCPDWMKPLWGYHLLDFHPTFGLHLVQRLDGEWDNFPLWITVSPKPGYIDFMVEAIADEIKIIYTGLGDRTTRDRDGWPNLSMANFWSAELGRLVYLQPCNRKNEIDQEALQEVMEVIQKNPNLRLSVQLHKMLSIP